jgi:YggT family protein
MYVLGYPLLALANILAGVLWCYSLVVLASVIISFFKVNPYHPAMRILHMLTEPAYRKVRPYMPKMGGIDLSPLAILLIISFIEQGILPIIRDFAASLLS